MKPRLVIFAVLLLSGSAAAQSPSASTQPKVRAWFGNDVKAQRKASKSPSRNCIPTVAIAPGSTDTVVASKKCETDGKEKAPSHLSGR